MWHQKNHSVNYESDFQLHHQFIGAPHLSAPNVKLGPGPAPTGPRAGAFEFWHLIVEIWFGEKVSTNTTLGLPRQEFTKKLNPSLYKIWSSNVSTHRKVRDMKSIQWQDFWYCCMNCNNIQRTHTHEHATKEAKQITENLKHIPKRHTKTKKGQKETERDRKRQAKNPTDWNSTWSNPYFPLPEVSMVVFHIAMLNYQRGLSLDALRTLVALVAFVEATLALLISTVYCTKPERVWGAMPDVLAPAEPIAVTSCQRNSLGHLWNV